MATKLSDARAVTTRQPFQAPVVDNRSPLLDGDTFASMFRLAEALAKARTLPQHLQGNPGDCLRVVEYAYRCGYSPYALADCTFLVGGKMGFEGKAVAAMVNASPLIDGALDYRYEGTGEARKVTVSGRRRGEQTVRTVEWTVRQGIADSKGARDRWTKDPDQMLAYAGARIWARRHCPEAVLGIYTPDEILTGVDAEQMIDITPRDKTPEPEHHEVGEHDPETGEVETKPDAAEARRLYREAKAALERDDHDAAVRARMDAAPHMEADAKVAQAFGELFGDGGADA